MMFEDYVVAYIEVKSGIQRVIKEGKTGLLVQAHIR